MLVTISINHETTNFLWVTYADEEGNIYLSVDDLKKTRIHQDYLQQGHVRFHNADYVNLKDLEGTKSTLDFPNLHLEIHFPLESLQLQSMSALRQRKPTEVPQESAHGAFLNYSLSMSHQKQGYHATVIPEMNYFTKYGTWTHSTFVSYDPKMRVKKTKKKDTISYRLQTYWTYDHIQSLTRWRLGDSTTRSAKWSGATRFAGLQYAKHWGIEPHASTHPLPSFQGKAGLPSTVEVFKNSSRLYRTDVKSGDYSLHDLPITGNGELAVRVKDMKGEIRTFIVPYYVVPKLLKAGIADYSLSFGTQRQNYASEDSLYKKFISNYDFMYGVNDSWTTGIHFESLNQIASLGMTNIINLKQFGIFEVSVGSNLNKLKDHQTANLNYFFQKGNFLFTAKMTKNGKHFYHTFRPDSPAGNDMSWDASVSYTTKRLGSFSLSWLSFVPKTVDKKGEITRDKKVRTVYAQYVKNLTPNTSFRAHASKNLSKQETSISFSLNVRLRNCSIQTSAARRSGSWTKSMSIASQDHSQNAWRYRLNLRQDQTNDFDVHIEKPTNKVDTSFSYFHHNHEDSQNLRFRGSLVAMNGGVFPTKYIHHSFVFVKANELSDIPVSHNNRLTTKTNADGHAIIPNVSAYHPAQISLDPNAIPLDVNFSNTRVDVVPQWKSGAFANFDLNRIQSLQLQLLKKDQSYMPLGDKVTLKGFDQVFYIGYDGVLFIQDIQGAKTLDGQSCSTENCCRFQAKIKDENFNGAFFDLGNITCK